MTDRPELKGREMPQLNSPAHIKILTMSKNSKFTLSEILDYAVVFPVAGVEVLHLVVMTCGGEERGRKKDEKLRFQFDVGRVDQPEGKKRISGLDWGHAANQKSGLIFLNNFSPIVCF